MKSIVIGAHLRREDVEPLADAVPAGALFLSTLPVAEQQALGDRELLLRVADVRARLLDRATFIAIRYGLTITSEADAAAKTAAHAARWKTTLEANAGRVEMTLKVAAASPRPRPNRHDFTSGAAYLKALHDATQASNVDPSFREAIERTLVPKSVQHRWSHRDEKSIELALLIARDDVDPVRAAGEALRATGVAFLLSGPWPLEVFADADHE
ncbi:MAG: Gas vesicle synthesis protein GvpL/GvpF [Acidobacteriota bacterium]|jgi:hypothetical protein|nr:Gas vesicle synthesis protein GvpL/GvpF [Acidobacteriota bacterium]